MIFVPVSCFREISLFGLCGTDSWSYLILMLLATSRLTLAPATTEAPHVNLVCNLWNDPRVMRRVGFPEGLCITPEEIISVIERRSTDLPEAILIVRRTADGALVGHCKLGRPDASGVSENDIKLLPE